MSLLTSQELSIKYGWLDVFSSPTLLEKLLPQLQEDTLKEGGQIQGMEENQLIHL